MIFNISTRPKIYPPKLNANDLFKSYQFFIKLIIIDEPETSLEQNALISNLISLRNTQQLTSIIATPILLS
ncbi:hypothetical protein HMPREF1396_01312 [Helicobacter pylori GAM114Ai]|uniref:hypothetical protein n=1 Tax=Helicobacter pylori TaxID=210 RepID=UPI0002BAE10C|nr:hypothetical protein HMPREF1396_01312 [Helicobacter pylori GAM114Ai]